MDDPRMCGIRHSVIVEPSVGEGTNLKGERSVKL